MSGPIYAIGDIHGQHQMLQDALEWIDADGGRDAQVTFLGDYVDRGPNSRGVLETLKNGVTAGRNWIALKGNHDRMFQWFMEDSPRPDPHLKITHSWLHPALGGRETLASYGVRAEENERLIDVHQRAKEAVPNDHIEFLQSLRTYHQTGSYLFVHAGICPGVALKDQVENDLLWIREPFLSYSARHPWLVVHGHTALEAPEDCGNRLNLDSGAGYGRPLTVAVMEGENVWWLKKEGRVPVR